MADVNKSRSPVFVFSVMWISTFLIFFSVISLIVVHANELEKILKQDQYDFGMANEEDQLFFKSLRDDSLSQSSIFSSLCALPDSTMTICFMAVVSYMLYIILSMILKPSLVREVQMEANTGLKVLLVDHQFKDNNVPVKLKNLYEDSGSNIPEETSLGTPSKMKQEVLPLEEKVPLLSSQASESDSEEIGRGGLIHL